MDTHVDSPRADVERDLRITRIIPATPAAVFAAWTEAEQVRAWFGPYGMTVPECTIEPHEGGRFHAVMRDAAGQDYPCDMIIEAIAAPRRLGWRVPEGDAMPALVGATCTLSFEEHPIGTRLAAHWRHPSVESRMAHEAMGFRDGWGQTLDKLGAHLVRPPANAPLSLAPAPEHGWLMRLLGNWTYETEASGPPGQPPARAMGTERVRPLGPYWVIGEGEGECPSGAGHVRMVTSMGFDPAARRFRGSWVGSMMPHMFLYDGALDEAARRLVLDTTGPSFVGEGMARYRETVEMRDDDERVVSSEVELPDGAWQRIMRAEFRRVG
jgi:uncharacterized protein YndB with AHSA1/START domain